MAWFWLSLCGCAHDTAGSFTAGWEKLACCAIFGAAMNTLWVFSSAPGAAINGFAKGALTQTTGAAQLSLAGMLFSTNPRRRHGDVNASHHVR